MDNIVFQRDYRDQPRHKMDKRLRKIGDRLLTGTFFSAYAEALDRLLKFIVPEDKANYEYLLPRLDAFVKAKHGKIEGVVDYQKWESRIKILLPFLNLAVLRILSF